MHYFTLNLTEYPHRLSRRILPLKVEAPFKCTRNHAASINSKLHLFENNYTGPLMTQDSVSTIAVTLTGRLANDAVLTILINSKNSNSAELRRLYFVALDLRALTTGWNKLPLMMYLL